MAIVQHCYELVVSSIVVIAYFRRARREAVVHQVSKRAFGHIPNGPYGFNMAYWVRKHF